MPVSGAVTVAGRGLGWCTGRVVVPLVFRHGVAEAAFTIALAVWLVFELVMRVRQRLQSKGPASVDRSAFILVPCLAGCVVLAEVLGRRGGLPARRPVWPVSRPVSEPRSPAFSGRTATSAIPPTPGSPSCSPGWPWPVTTCGAW